jgi:hypothetical protein
MHSIELVKLYLESCDSMLESVPERIATGFTEKLQVLGFQRPQRSHDSMDTGQRGVDSIELVELYLESCDSTLESVPERIAKGFSEKLGFLPVFLPVFTFFSVFPKSFEKKGEVG